MCSSKYVVLSVYLKKKWFETNVVFFEEWWESWDVNWTMWQLELWPFRLPVYHSSITMNKGKKRNERNTEGILDALFLYFPSNVQPQSGLC